MEKKLDTQRSVVVGIGLASTIERSSFRYSSESDLVLKSSIGDEMNNNATTTKTRKSSIKDSESSSSNTQTTVSSNSEEIPSLINDDDDDVNNDDVFDESGENSSNRSEENRKRQLEKFNILKEVLSSEKKYLNDLREIVEGYYEEIKKFSTDEFVYHIFSNIKDIYEFTKSFYLLLESSTDDEVGIANCFIKKHKVFLRLYSTYCQNYRIAYNSTEKLESENNIAKIIQKIRLKYGHCLKMTTYLQLPVLRITKYHLLLQRYLNLLQVNSAAYNQVLEALELMKHVNDSINQEMPADDDNYSNSATANATNRSNSIAGSSTSTSHTSIVNINNFIKLFGQILKQGNLLLVQSKKVHYVILFQKMLIIRKADSPNKIMHSISNENLALLPTSCKVKTRSFTVIDYSQPKDGAMWQIFFKAKTDEEKKSWQSSILSCMLNGYSKNKISDRIKTNINNVAASASLGNAHQINNATSNAVAASNLLVVPNNRSAHDIIREKLANFRRLTEFRHSLRTSESLKETTTSSLGNIRQQFEDAFRRRLSNPVTASSQSAAATSSSSSKIVGKLLDKTLTLGTFTKETLASPMMKFRRNNQLARINELDYSSTKDSPTNHRQRHQTASASSSLARSSTTTPVTSTKSDSTSKKQHLLQHPPSPPPPVPKQQQIKTRSDSYNAIVATSPDPKPVESARLHHSIVMPLDYLNRSYDNVQMVDDDDDDEMMMVNDEEVEKRETERRFIQYRSIISEMNRAFEEKYGTRKCNDDDNDEEEKKNDEFENLKKMDVKEPETQPKPALALTDNNNDISNKNNENRAATNTNRSSKSSINSSEEGYYSNHDSSESSCSNSTLIENTTTTESSSSSSSSPSSISSSGSKPTSFSPPQTPDTLKEPVEEETRTISPFPVVKSQQPVVKIVSSLPPVPPSSSTSPLFKLEKISIKKIDFGEAIDSRKELEITDLLNQTATLTVNLSKPPQPPPNSHGLRITPSRSCSRNDETDSKHRETSQHRSDHSSKPNLTTSTMTKTKPNLSTYSFNLKSSLSSGLNSTTLHASNSEYEIGRKLHSFKISASPSSNTSSNGETTNTTSRAAKNASKLSLNNANLTLGDKTTAKTRTSSSNNLDHVSFVNVKELINKFECKLLDNVL